jgi:hypothetical protein
MGQGERSHTYVLELNGRWTGAFASEPYETGWAREAIIFVRTLKSENLNDSAVARVQVSPDGMHWCDEGSSVALSPEPDAVTFCRLSHFGGWLRLTGEVSRGAINVIAYISLKE